MRIKKTFRTSTVFLGVYVHRDSSSSFPTDFPATIVGEIYQSIEKKVVKKSKLLLLFKVVNLCNKNSNGIP